MRNRIFSLALIASVLIVATGGISAAQKKPDTTRVVLKTSLGDITVALFNRQAPATVANFLAYVDKGFFDGTIFHRVIPGFMVQGGGYTRDLVEKETRPAIKNESTNGLRNARGTLSMARTSDPHSATSQFFINLVDNSYLDSRGGEWGYTVFGKVISGMETVDKIAHVATETRGGMENVPKELVVITSAKRKR